MKDDLGDRIKNNYEDAYRITLPKRLPIIIRLDGRSFSSYTKNCKRPFDNNLSDVMAMTAKKLCFEVQGAVIAYTQSDEISLLVHNYKNLNSQPWFDNNIQKIVSVAASIAGVTFTLESDKIFYDENRVIFKPAYFDARVFVLPESEVCNYFIWRQNDASRNSIQQLARSLYSHKQLINKKCNEIKDMCSAKNSSWDDLEPRYRKGICVSKSESRGWKIDLDIPIFSQDRSYIEKHLKVEI